VNFTREPIIETIITPKEGSKLLVRSSKGGGQEEFAVEAIEVVSFGNALFFRSQERPKSFLVPVSDYEVVEAKETRVQLKAANVERSIKIGGGREAPPRREAPAAEKPEEGELSAEGAEEGSTEAPHQEQRYEGGKRRDRRRHRRRRGGEERQGGWQERSPEEAKPASTEADSAQPGGDAKDETTVSSSLFTNLIPPPPTLISEKLAKYKEKDAGHSQGAPLSHPVEERKEDTSSGEKTELLRTVTTEESFTLYSSGDAFQDPFFR
jgi:hypothetical protein